MAPSGVTADLVTKRWQPAWPINSHLGRVSGREVPGWEVKL